MGGWGRGERTGAVRNDCSKTTAMLHIIEAELQGGAFRHELPLSWMRGLHS